MMAIRNKEQLKKYFEDFRASLTKKKNFHKQLMEMRKKEYQKEYQKKYRANRKQYLKEYGLN